MAQRRHHYERAFEWFLRHRRIPYIAVDEAKKALMPEQAHLSMQVGGPALKSFDFVIYGEGPGTSGGNLLVDIKGRRVTARTRGDRPGRLECWVTMEDIESLTQWQQLFGPGFTAALVFVYWCERQPPDALFQEIFEYREIWYALRAVTVADYAQAMKIRSPRWRTVDLPRGVFERISQPFAPPPSPPTPRTPPSPPPALRSMGNPTSYPKRGPEVELALRVPSEPAFVPLGER